LRGIAERLNADIDPAVGGEEGHGEKKQRNQRTFHPAILHVRRAPGDRICRCCMALPPLRYRAVLFDLDGTLVDSYAALAEAVNFARREHGLDELNATRIRGFVGDGLDTMLRRAFDVDQVPRSVKDAFESRYDEICCEASTILADVESTLGTLHERGVAMAVCTNKPTSFSKKILTFLQLAPYFRAIVGPDLAGARKPEACEAREALFVGDMPIDIQAARNSGMDVAVVSTGSSTLEALQAERADYYLARFSDLVRVACG